MGCDRPRTERELLIQANALATQGRTADARVVYQAALDANPQSADVLIRFAGFSVEQGDLDTARQALQTLDGIEMGRTDRARMTTERRRYFQAILARVSGPNGGPPSDVVAYEDAMVGLLAIERGGPLLDEWANYLLATMRRAAGGRGEQPLAVQDPNGPLSRLPAAQVPVALDAATRLLDGDPRLTFRPRLQPAVEAEARVVRERLEQMAFLATFNAVFAQRHRAQWEATGRYDATRDLVTIGYVGPWYNGLSPDSSPELLQQQAQTFYAREIATDAVYTIAGQDRGAAPPLPYRLTDFSTAVASGMQTTETGEFEFLLELPWQTIERGAELLRVRLAEAEAAARDLPPAVSADAAPPAGSGALELDD